MVLHPEFINTLAHLRSLELGNCRCEGAMGRAAERPGGIPLCLCGHWHGGHGLAVGGALFKIMC